MSVEYADGHVQPCPRARPKNMPTCIHKTSGKSVNCHYVSIPWSSLGCRSFAVISFLAKITGYRRPIVIHLEDAVDNAAEADNQQLASWH
jgi:hypothetical protein